MLQTHIVEPGETLFTIAKRYASTPEQLAEINNLANSRSLFTGQELIITAGQQASPLRGETAYYTVSQADNWLRLGMVFDVTPQTLADANGLSIDAPLQAGQRLIVPQSANAGRFVDLPAPILDFQITPLPATQGETISAFLRLEDAENFTVTGRIFDRDVPFFFEAGAFYAVIGVHAFLEPGIYPFSLMIAGADGNTLAYENRIRVSGGVYGREDINLPPDRQTLLDPTVVEPELARLQEIVSPLTERKLFDGLMSLPSTGPITSQYGTRRSYNGSEYNTFHSGADFGGAPGSLILAPADGVVVLAEPLQVRGNAIVLDHGWGVYSGYWHNTELFVASGQFVGRGDAIATLGSSGLVTGAHLHWEIWVNGIQVNPLQWLTQPFDIYETASTDGG